MNHSCNHNFYASELMVKVNSRLVVFAKCNIKLGEKLTLHHQWDMRNSRNTAEFYCISHNSRVFLGKESDMLTK